MLKSDAGTLHDVDDLLRYQTVSDSGWVNAVEGEQSSGCTSTLAVTGEEPGVRYRSK
jgi:hypothetical protein